MARPKCNKGVIKPATKHPASAPVSLPPPPRPVFRYEARSAASNIIIYPRRAALRAAFFYAFGACFPRFFPPVYRTSTGKQPKNACISRENWAPARPISLPIAYLFNFFRIFFSLLAVIFKKLYENVHCKKRATPLYRKTPAKGVKTGARGPSNGAVFPVLHRSPGNMRLNSGRRYAILFSAAGRQRSFFGSRQAAEQRGNQKCRQKWYWGF